MNSFRKIFPNAEGFNDLFEQKLRVVKSPSKAYEEAEKEFEEEFGVNKYASYDSFRRCRSKKKKPRH